MNQQTNIAASTASDLVQGIARALFGEAGAGITDLITLANCVQGGTQCLAEPGEQQRAALPRPLEELRDAAQHALDCADGGDDYACGRPMIEALTTLGIMEKTGRGLWSTNVQIARSVVDALAATGKQQVVEVQGDARANSRLVRQLSAMMALATEGDTYILHEAIAAIAARQPEEVSNGQPTRVYSLDVLGNPMRKDPSGAWESADWPSARQPVWQKPVGEIIERSDSNGKTEWLRRPYKALSGLNRMMDMPVGTLIYAAPPAQLAVWWGPMPESNGRQNWTAMLYRKGDDIFGSGSITIDRSEYPDRVRYEADRLRYLIGERDEEPDIMKYDANLHSGYVEQAAQGIDLGQQQDAERYRWLRDHYDPSVHDDEDGSFLRLAGEELDAAIDDQRDAAPGVGQ